MQKICIICGFLLLLHRQITKKTPKKMILTATKQKMLDKYLFEPSDLMFCDLVLSGWGKIEAAFFAYGLAYEDNGKIRSFLKNHVARYWGIEQYMKDKAAEDSEKSSRLTARAEAKAAKAEAALEQRIEDEVNRRLKEMMDGNQTNERLSKEDLGNLYTNIIHDPTADSKTKMDAAKNYTALYQMTKVEEAVEDNRINFYLPMTCNKCELYKKHKEETINATDQERQGV